MLSKYSNLASLLHILIGFPYSFQIYEYEELSHSIAPELSLEAGLLFT